MMTEKPTAKHSWLNHYGGLILLALLLGLTFSGGSLALFNRLSGPLNTYNEAYIDRAIKDTTQVMVPVGLAKGAIDLVEGTTLNIEAGVVVANAGTDIEVGDVLQPLLDYLDLAWQVLLINLIYLVSAKYILQGYGPIAEGLLLLALSGYLLLSLLQLKLETRKGLWLPLRRVSAICLLGALFFSAVLPLTVFTSAQLAKTTTDPVRGTLYAAFSDLEEVCDLAAFHEAETLKARAAALQLKTADLMRYALTASSELAANVARLAVIKILNGVVFPLLALAFLIWIVRSTLIPTLGLGPVRAESGLV